MEICQQSDINATIKELLKLCQSRCRINFQYRVFSLYTY
ncbi:hypothetical Protein YC6258_01410 [Gynuella sunshinyii YC6258]|uniref:Uncharacterized protein n=1 Tax=Gynuella sunshinyii YC6258 TaxID=1445510 RepID=A0A0C5VJ84_9GAMM|nr:hypothetical Protein YC6258_01410 [Gynuella sunshinyii YC6258]